jgi:hypothetical protein
LHHASKSGHKGEIRLLAVKVIEVFRYLAQQQTLKHHHHITE